MKTTLLDLQPLRIDVDELRAIASTGLELAITTILALMMVAAVFVWSTPAARPQRGSSGSSEPCPSCETPAQRDGSGREGGVMVRGSL